MFDAVNKVLNTKDDCNQMFNALNKPDLDKIESKTLDTALNNRLKRLQHQANLKLDKQCPGLKSFLKSGLKNLPIFETLVIITN